MHKLQAKIIPDCLFKCIFSTILKPSLHFKIISMPIYSEPQVEAPDHNAFAANIVISSAPGWRKNLFFLRKNMKICANGAMAQPGLNTERESTVIKITFKIQAIFAL